jgi:hypothetical protein
VLVEAEARLDALSGRVERVQRALAEQRTQFQGPATPETAREFIEAVGGLADQMRRVVDEVRRERERVIQQVVELAEAVRSLHAELDGVRAMQAGALPAPSSRAAEAPAGEAPPTETALTPEPRPVEPAAAPQPRAAASLHLPPVLTVALSPLEGFGRVLLLRAALLQRPDVQAASILRYADGGAELHLVLEQPLPPDAVCALLSDAAGRPAELRSLDLAAGAVGAVLAS